MRQYRPNVERQKLLYSRMKFRALLRRLQGKSPINTAIAEGRKQIPNPDSGGRSPAWLMQSGFPRDKDAMDIAFLESKAEDGDPFADDSLKNLPR